MECFAKSKYQPGGDLLRLFAENTPPKTLDTIIVSAKSPNYRYVDVITILQFYRYQRIAFYQ
jgi:hypothetical protein